MKVVFSDRSRARLHEIQGYIAFHNIRAAEKVVDRIIYAAEMLGDHPHLGVVWQGGPTRALTVPGLPYRVHYRVDEGGGAGRGDHGRAYESVAAGVGVMSRFASRERGGGNEIANEW